MADALEAITVAIRENRHLVERIEALEKKVAKPHDRLAAIEARMLANWLHQRAVFAELLAKECDWENGLKIALQQALKDSPDGS